MPQKNLLAYFTKRPATAEDIEAKAAKVAKWAEEIAEQIRKRKLEEEAANAAVQQAKRPVGRPRKDPNLNQESARSLPDGAGAELWRLGHDPDCAVKVSLRALLVSVQLEVVAGGHVLVLLEADRVAVIVEPAPPAAEQPVAKRSYKQWTDEEKAMALQAYAKYQGASAAARHLRLVFHDQFASVTEGHIRKWVEQKEQQQQAEVGSEAGPSRGPGRPKVVPAEAEAAVCQAIQGQIDAGERQSHVLSSARPAGLSRR